MKNIDLIPKEDDWIISTVIGCLSFLAALPFLRYSFGVWFAVLAAINLIYGASLHGRKKWVTLGLFFGLWLVWSWVEISAHYHWTQLDPEKGRQNYLLGAAWLALALWGLGCIVTDRRKKGKQPSDKADMSTCTDDK
jgi:hypothetical protein